MSTLPWSAGSGSGFCGCASAPPLHWQQAACKFAILLHVPVVALHVVDLLLVVLLAVGKVGRRALQCEVALRSASAEARPSSYCSRALHVASTAFLLSVIDSVCHFGSRMGLAANISLATSPTASTSFIHVSSRLLRRAKSCPYLDQIPSSSHFLRLVLPLPLEMVLHLVRTPAPAQARHSSTWCCARGHRTPPVCLSWPRAGSKSQPS